MVESAAGKGGKCRVAAAIAGHFSRECVSAVDPGQSFWAMERTYIIGIDMVVGLSARRHGAAQDM